MKRCSTAAAVVATLTFAMPALAAGRAVTVEKGLPAVCTRDAGNMHTRMHGGAMKGMEMNSDHGTAHDMDVTSKAGRAMMQGMADMDRDMAIGMRAKDPDVAFLCGMIPHHRGAIAMAKAELKYGKDAWSKALARDIIAAQQKEIRAMLDRLDRMK